MEHAIVSRQEWLDARRQLLAREKEATRLRDRLNAERLAMPWVLVDKDYVFDTPEGSRRLADLFSGRSQLIVYHFMFAPEWEEGCTGCSFLADHFDGALAHLNHHDVSLVAVSRAPLPRLLAYRRRMGWSFPWVSSAGSDFNADYHVSFTDAEVASGEVYYNYRREPVSHGGVEAPGMSSFYRNAGGQIFHTYSSYGRGPEEFIGALMILDRAPLGRNEDQTMDFVRRHDEYQPSATAASGCCHS